MLSGSAIQTRMYFIWMPLYPADSIELMRSILGERAQMHCTGLGKAMLANMGEREISDYLEHHKLEAFTENSIIDKKQFREELLRTKQRGYALDDMEQNLVLSALQCLSLIELKMSMLRLV